MREQLIGYLQACLSDPALVSPQPQPEPALAPEALPALAIYEPIYELIKSEAQRSPHGLTVFVGGCEADYSFQLISYKLQKVCAAYQDQGRPLEIFVGEWFSLDFQKHSAIATLCHALNTESVLVIDTGIFGSWHPEILELHTGYWHKNSQTYIYHHQAIALDHHNYAWQQFRSNWTILVPDYVEIYICLFLDQHFFRQGYAPLLPQLLNIDNSSISNFCVGYYQDLYTNSRINIGLLLDLVISLRDLASASTLSKWLQEFLTTWLHTRQITPDHQDIKHLVSLVQSSFKLEEWQDMQKLNTCLAIVNIDCQLNLMEVLHNHEFEFTALRINPQGLSRRSRTNRTKCFWQPLGDDSVKLPMVYIPSGIFRMGSPPTEVGHETNESPMHWVAISTFFMGKYPVTQAQWRAIAQLPARNRKLENDPSEFKHDNHPVHNVSWHDAIEFCDRLNYFTGLNYRLPTEAEWEYACRSGTKTPFHCGETITTKFVNYDGTYPYGFGAAGEYRQQTTEVGSFEAANNYGLYDMHGQVLEWCADPWHENYIKAPNNGQIWLETEASLENQRILRGGSWFNVAGRCRSGSRHHYAGDIWLNHIGFRVALTS